MKKIAFLINIFPPQTAAFVINQILNALSAGYEIGIFPRILNESKKICQPEIIKNYDLMDKVVSPVPRYASRLLYIKWLSNALLRTQRELVPYFIKSLNPILFGMSWTRLFMFRKIVQFHGAPDFDIYHCQFGNNGYIASGLKELGIIKGKIITTFHGYDAHFEDKKLQNYYRTGIRTWSRLLFKHSDLITVNTPYLFKQVRALGANPDKIELLPMGVDTTFFKPGQNPRNLDTLRLVSIGRLLELKSHDLGIQAVSEIVAEGVNLKYLIIGEGPQRQNLLQLIDRLNLKKHVKLLGHQSQAEIRNILQDSDIFLMTSTFDGSGRREAQGLVTAEAQACGLPVVAFRSGGVPYTIEEGTTGFLAEEKNVGEFAHHLKNLCADEALRKDMGRAARKFVERSFCLSRLAQKQLSLYEKVLQR